jgi:hypothetical protein
MLETNSLYQVPGTSITIGRIYRKQAGKASQQLIQIVWINGRIGNAPFQASEVLSDRFECDLCVGVFVTPPHVTASARSHTVGSIIPGRITDKQLQTLGKANTKRRMIRKY